MIEFKLPSLGSDMDEGKLLEWHVKPGDAVQRGQVVAVVDTSKAAVDVEIWHDGTVFELLVQPGETVPVGAVLATLLEPGETAEHARQVQRSDQAPPPAPAAVPASVPVRRAVARARGPAARVAGRAQACRGRRHRPRARDRHRPWRRGDAAGRRAGDPRRAVRAGAGRPPARDAQVDRRGDEPAPSARSRTTT